MGGIGSGSWCRWSKTLKVEDCACLNVSWLKKHGAIIPDKAVSGVWHWSSGQNKSSVSFLFDLTNSQNMFLRLRYDAVSSNQSYDYKIRLERTGMHFGGYRYWLICPYTNKRSAKLYLADTGKMFASREALGLKYESQSEDYKYRMVRKKHKIFSGFKTDYSFPMRPKGMHYKTFDRLSDKYLAQEALCDGILFRLINKI